jgi:uncharacterized protein YndB with AHSA1/START domain
VADILQDFVITATPDRVFRAVSTPAELDSWWTMRSAGAARVGTTYDLGFGPGYDWRAEVTQCVPDENFELHLIQADADWLGTRVGFHLERHTAGTQVHFHHTGWPRSNEHYRTSCYCWAMYLRLLRRMVEQGEIVPYERRLDV